MSESAAPTSAPIYLTIPQNVNSQSDKDHIEKLFPTKTMKVCSILQLICAGTAALTQVRSHQKSLILQFIFWNTLISGDFIRCGSTKVWFHIRCWGWNLDRTFLWYRWRSWFDCFTKTLSLLVRIALDIFLSIKNYLWFSQSDRIYGDEHHFFTFCYSFDCHFWNWHGYIRVPTILPWEWVITL